MNQEETKIEQISLVLDEIEEQNLKDDPGISSWLGEIAKPEFKLIDSLINLFLDKLLDLKLTNDILKVLRYLLLEK
jgi:hypothetical protein